MNKDSGGNELLGVARLVRQRDEREAELGVVIADRWQGAGLGTELLRRLLEIARNEGIQQIKAEILSENAAMLALAKLFHFKLVPDDDLRSLTATLDLEPSVPASDVRHGAR